MKLFSRFLILLLLLVVIAQPAFAATFRGGETITLSEEVLTDNAYLAGEKIIVTIPAQKDVLAGGSILEFKSPIERSLMAAGGTITVSGAVGNSIRVAGGTITLDGPVAEDVVVAGGQITVTKNASISGDLVITGGQLTIDGPVSGNVYANGGEVTINSIIGGNVEGEMGSLLLGSNASIGGNLTYSAEEELKKESGAQVAGTTSFNSEDRNTQTSEGLAAFFTIGTLYTLIIDILFSLLFVLVLGFFTSNVLSRIDEGKLKSLSIGFSSIFLLPLAGLFLLVIIWLGITWFVAYLLLLLLSLGLMKVYTGAKILQWWQRRQKKEYILDWKAAVIGSISILILTLIPILGWLVIFVLYLLAFGGLVREVTTYITEQASPK